MCIRDSATIASSYERDAHMVLQLHLFLNIYIAAMPVSYTHLDVYKRQHTHSVSVKERANVEGQREGKCSGDSAGKDESTKWATRAHLSFTSSATRMHRR